MPADARSHDDYNVGWICALPLEMAAAKTMVDEVHPSLPQPPNDSNTYVLGRVGSHNVVIASLPSGIYGTTSAAIVGKQMLSTFQSIRFGLLVGIGGGVPTYTDIRLGDIVVSQPNDISPGVVQYDYGKTVISGRLQRTGARNLPPQELLTALSHVESNRMTGKSELWSHISKVTSDETLASFHSPGAETDNLFSASYYHDASHVDCSKCDRDQILKRRPRQSEMPMIHCGTIASGNQVMKNGKIRDRLARELGILCFEMEAAGLMDHFPCLVIRGVCDYADSHKHKAWQGYAAITAAAYAKELLTEVPLKHVQKQQNSNSSRFDVRFNTIDIPQLSHFAGRDQELAEIHDSLNTDTPSRVVVLQGLGGIGKTQLATKYVLQHQHEYSAIFWLDATSISTMRRGFIEMVRRIMLDHDMESFKNFISIQKEASHQSLTFSEAGKITLSKLNSLLPSSMRGEESSSDEIIEALKLWLSNLENPRWLLVFDNYIPEYYPPFKHHDCRGIQKFLPYAHQGDVLVTTTAPKISIGKTINVQRIGPRDSLQILRSTSGREGVEEDLDASTLVDEMDGIPLALAAAGKYLRQVPITIPDYLALYKDHFLKLQSQSPQALDYEKTMYTNFEIAYSNVIVQCSAAHIILCEWASLDSHDIWRELLMGSAGPVEELATDPILFHEAMRLLSDYGLVEVGPEPKRASSHSRGYRMPKPLHSSLVHYFQTRGRFNEAKILSRVIHLNKHADWILENKSHDDFRRWVPHAKRSWEIVSQNASSLSDEYNALWALKSVKIGRLLERADLWPRPIVNMIILDMFGAESESCLANLNLARQWLAFSLERMDRTESQDDLDDLKCIATSNLLSLHHRLGNYSEIYTMCRQELEPKARHDQNRPQTIRRRLLYWECRAMLFISCLKTPVYWYIHLYPALLLFIFCILCIREIISISELGFIFGLYMTMAPLLALMLGRISWQKSAVLFIALVFLMEMYTCYCQNSWSWMRYFHYPWVLLPVVLWAYFEGFN